jgi:hypothetical protein
MKRGWMEQDDEIGLVLAAFPYLPKLFWSKGS